MNRKCPGQDGRNLRSALYRCPGCGEMVEMFSDEMRMRCRKCGQHVQRDTVPSCIEWCKSARQCLGEEKWRLLTGGDSNRETRE